MKEIKPKSKNPLLLQEVRKLFEEEAQIIYNQGKHNQIPTVLDEFEENQNFYLVQEYIEGNSLKSEIYQGKFNETEAIALLEDVLQILTFVHRQVLHLDIKPSNLIRRASDGQIILTDFGSFKQLSSLILNEQEQLIITRFVGSDGYMPKEQYTRSPNPSNDIYALGMTIIHALTGLFPTEIGQDSNTGELGWRNYTHVSDELAAIVNKMVNSYFRDRYQSADEVLNDLWSINSQGELLISSETAASVELKAIDNEIVNENYDKSSYGFDVSNQALNKIDIDNDNFVVDNTDYSIDKLTSINFATKKDARKNSALRLLPFVCVFFVLLVTTVGIVVFSGIKFIYLLNQCKKLIEAEQPEVAESYCAAAIKIKQNDSNALKKYADVLFELQRYYAALITYNKAIENKQDFYLAWNGRGLVLDKLERYQESLDSYDKAINLSADNSKAWNGKGVVLIGMGKFEEALEAFNKAISVNPRKPQSWENRGIALEYLKRNYDGRKAFTEAIALLEQQIKNDPGNIVAMVDRGRILDKLKRHQEALVSYEEALKLKPDFYRAWIGKGNSLFFLKRFDDALDAYENATKSRPNYHIVWHNQGSFLADGLQRYEEAVAFYQKAIDLEPNFAPAWRDKGLALMRLDKNQQAIDAFDQAIKINPSDFQSWGSRGIALTKLKNYDAAIASLNKAISLNSQDPVAWANLGWTLGEIQKYEEAIAAYDKAIEIKPDFVGAIKARKELQEKI